MTDYSITLPSYSIGEQVYKQIPTVLSLIHISEPTRPY